MKALIFTEIREVLQTLIPGIVILYGERKTLFIIYIIG
jgi:hypothetical protein